jgi:hypothetical protein
LVILTCGLMLSCQSKVNEVKTVGAENKLNVPTNTIIQKMISSTPADYLGEENVCNFDFKYLGAILAEEGNIYFVSTMSLDAGINCRNTTRILVYDSLYNYLGNYYTQGILPQEIINGRSLFGNEFFNIDFSNGIPDSISTHPSMWARFEKE